MRGDCAALLPSAASELKQPEASRNGSGGGAQKECNKPVVIYPASNGKA
jgi:hypothetical protein